MSRGPRRLRKPLLSDPARLHVVLSDSARLRLAARGLGPLARAISARLRLAARGLRPLAALALVAGVGIGAAAPEGSVRVLLHAGAGPLRVGGGGLPRGGASVEVRAGTLHVAGRAAGRVWRLGPAPVDAAPLSLDAFRVRGSLEIRPAAEGLRVVNQLPLEAYVAATLGRELYPGWEPEVQKAQAVVARTYALHRLRGAAGRSYHLRRDARDQVYGGLDAETPAASRAAAATRGEFLRFAGAPILAVYHSASGGRTASAEEVWGRAVPYLVSRVVPDEEDSPDTYWRARVTRTTLRRALAALGVEIGSIRTLRVAERSASGRVARVRVTGSHGSEELGAGALRRALGADVIRSTLFEIRPGDEGFVITGSGHGHGVGMSQWGARAMAASGAGYREILAAFYPGTELVRSGAGATP